MFTGGGDNNLCPPGRFQPTSGSDVDLTAPFNIAAFGNQAYARVLTNVSSTAITIVVISRLDSVVVGGSATGFTIVLQPGQSLFGQFITIKNSGSSYTTGQLQAGS